MRYKLNKQDLLDIYNILFWVRANELQRAQNIIGNNKLLHQKVYSEANRKRN